VHRTSGQFAIDSARRRCKRARQTAVRAELASVAYAAAVTLCTLAVLGGVILSVLAACDTGRAWPGRLFRIGILPAAIIGDIVFWRYWTAAQQRQKRARRVADAAQAAFLRVDPDSAGIRQYGAERVIFVRGDQRGVAAGQRSIRHTLWVWSFGLLWAYFTLQLVGSYLGFFMPAPRRMGIFIVGCVFAAVVYRAGRIRRRGPYLAEHAGQSERLVVVGTPAELDEIGELADVAFEPQEFNLSWTPAALRQKVVRSTFVTTTALTAIATMFLFWQFWRELIYLVMISYACAGVAAYATVAVGWHTYLRVYPGRLELVQYSVFRPMQVYRESMPLRGARIRVNLWEHYFRVEHPEVTVHSKPWEFLTALVPRRRELAYYVLLAALSTHGPGPVDVES